MEGFRLTVLNPWVERIQSWCWPPALHEFARWHRAALKRELPLSQRINLRIMQGIQSHPRAKVTLADIVDDVELRVGTSDHFVFDQVFIDRQYEVDYPTPHRILDAGANIGLATLWFAQQHPNAKIIAIEPDPGNFQQLCRNTRRYPNIHCVHAALWHTRVPMQLIDPSTHAWAYRYEAADRSDEARTSDAGRVPSRTIDDLIEEFDFAPLDLLKLDIEGAERDVISAGGQWMDQVTTVLVECHDRWVAGCSEAVQQAFPRSLFDHQISGENQVLIRQPQSLSTTTR